MHFSHKWGSQLFKYLMLVLAVFLGLLMVGLFFGVARGASHRANINPEARLSRGINAPEADEADLHVEKTSSHNPVLAGNTLTYTIRITNSGVLTATGVIMTDTLPAGVTFISSNPGAPDCVYANQQVKCSLGNLQASANTLVTLTVKVLSSVTGSLTNGVAVTTLITETNLANNTTSLITTVNTRADLAIQKSDDPDPVLLNQLLTYTLNVTNNGPSDATSISVTDPLPQGVVFDSASPLCTRQARLITCTIASLAAGSSSVMTLTVQPNADVDVPIVNTASVSSTVTVDQNLSNNSSTATTTVLYNADLRLVKTGSASTLQTGETLTYTLQVSNTGPASIPGVLLTDPLPAEVTYQSVSTNRGSCTGGSTVSCQLGALAVGESALIKVVTVAGPEPGMVTNTAVVTGTSLYDPVLNNNTASYTTTINQLVDLGVSLADTPEPVVAGKVLTYNLQVSNTGTLAASGVIVTDTLPAKVSLKIATSSQGTCNNQPVVVCSLEVIGVGQSAQITITVDVHPSALGLINNTAKVSGAGPEASSLNNTALETTQVNAEADLRIVKSATSANVIAGTNITYTLVVNNQGPSQALNLLVEDTLPADVLFLSFTPGAPGCGHVNGVVSCSYPQLLPGGSRAITMTGQVSETKVGLMHNQASVAAGTFDRFTTNNLAAVDVLVTPEIISPTVSWVLPIKDEEILHVTNENILLVALVADNVGVERVWFYRWDVDIDDYVDIQTVFSPPYQAYLDTTVLNPDWNQIFVKAYDVSGNESQRKRILLIRHLLTFMPLVSR